MSQLANGPERMVSTGGETVGACGVQLQRLISWSLLRIPASTHVVAQGSRLKPHMRGRVVLTEGGYDGGWDIMAAEKIWVQCYHTGGY